MLFNLPDIFPSSFDISFIKMDYLNVCLMGNLIQSKFIKKKNNLRIISVIIIHIIIL
jgi:hypothetical protein